MKTEVATQNELVYSCKFYDDDPECLQELILGEIRNGLFTGIIEHGGKYADTYYYREGKELDIDAYCGEDERMAAVTEGCTELKSWIDNDSPSLLKWTNDVAARYGISLKERKRNYFFNKDLFCNLDEYLIKEDDTSTIYPTHLIKRWEWAPVEFQYGIEAQNADEALKKLIAFDENGDDKIAGTRQHVETNCDADVLEIDEIEYWKIYSNNAFLHVSDALSDGHIKAIPKIKEEPKGTLDGYLIFSNYRSGDHANGFCKTIEDVMNIVYIIMEDYNNPDSTEYEENKDRIHQQIENLRGTQGMCFLKFKNDNYAYINMTSIPL
jgi:hypothetical protein